MKRVDLGAALTLALAQHAAGARELGLEGALQRLVAGDFAADIAHDPAKLGAQGAQGLVRTLELLGVGGALLLD